MGADEIANRIALLFNRMPDMSGRQINRLHGEQRRQVEDLASDIATALQQVTAERDEARAKQAVPLTEEQLETRRNRAHEAIVRRLQSERDAAKAEIAHLRVEGEAKDRRIVELSAALAPFARFGDMATPDTAETWAGVHHSFRIGTRFKHEHFRAARAATVREGA